MPRPKHAEHENHERWLVSYADFITLLFAFFVVMYSVSRIDNKRMSQAVSSIKWAMHFSGTGGVAQMPIFDGPAADNLNAVDLGGSGQPSPPQVHAEALRQRIQNRVQQFLVQRPGPPTVSIVAEGQMLTIRLAATEFFDPGQALLRPSVVPILDAIADEVVPLDHPLRVEGHTDDAPVLGGRFHDNWELSAARAATVVSYLERAHHARPDQLAAIGLAASRPLVDATTPEARETNRRIELVVELGFVQPDRAKRTGR